MWWEYSVYMYVNIKMRLIETILGIEGGVKENNGRDEFYYDKL
jgi:hypothetical protein